MVQQEADKMDTSDMDCGTGPSVHHPASHAVSKGMGDEEVDDDDDDDDDDDNANNDNEHYLDSLEELSQSK